MGRTVAVTENGSEKVAKIIYSDSLAYIELMPDGDVYIKDEDGDEACISKEALPNFLKAIKLAEKEGWFDESKPLLAMKTYKAILRCTGRNTGTDLVITTTAQDVSSAKVNFMSQETLKKYPGWVSYQVLDIEEVK